jgi:hypothetical protein
MDLPMTAPLLPCPRRLGAGRGCTLPTAAQPLRAADFDDLFAAALRAVERPPAAADRVRLVLAGEEGLAERVQRLPTRRPPAARLHLHAHAAGHRPGLRRRRDSGRARHRGAGRRADVLAGLIARAEQARRVTA